MAGYSITENSSISTTVKNNGEKKESWYEIEAKPRKIHYSKFVENSLSVLNWILNDTLIFMKIVMNRTDYLRKN